MGHRTNLCGRLFTVHFKGPFEPKTKKLTLAKFSFFFFFEGKRSQSHSKELKSESSYNHRASPKVTIAKATKLQAESQINTGHNDQPFNQNPTHLLPHD
jgi:hypothetical protein